MSNKQRALVVTEIGKPIEAISDRQIPQPGPGELQVKVTVAGINPHDQKARDWGLFIKDKLPAILTNDLVGKVTALGENVKNFAVGDRVATFSKAEIEPSTPKYAENGLQEYALTTADFTLKIPDSITDDEAATLPVNTMAPLVGLFVTLGFPAPWSDAAKGFDYAGTKLLIIGGGSSCGKFGVQLAKLAGIGQIVCVGGDEAELKSMGATKVLDRHGSQEEVLERIKAVFGDDLIYVFDAISPPELQILGLKALSSNKKGYLARLLPTGPVDESQVTGKKAGFEVRDVFGSSHHHPDLTKEFWARLPKYLEEGKIKPLQFVVKNGLTPENVNQVLDAYRDGQRVTKTHIHVS